MRKILTLIVHSYRESLHSKVIFFFFIFLALMILCSLFLGAADSADKVRVMQSVSFIVLGFFGSLLALLLPVLSLSEEIETKKVYNVLTKPVSRFTFLAGKLTGIMLFVFTFLSVMALVSYLFIIYNARAAGTKPILTAYRYKGAAAHEYVRPDGSFVEVETNTRKQTAFTRDSEFSSVRWVFTGMDRDVYTEEGFFKGKLSLPAQGIGVIHNIDYSRVFLRAVNSDTGERFRVNDTKKGEGRRYTVIPKKGTVDIYIPEKAVSSKGEVTVEVLRPGSKYKIFPQKRALAVYRMPGTYTGNYIKAVLFLFFKCIFIASVAICGAAFFSMASGITFGLCVILMSYLLHFIKENVAPARESLYQVIFFLFRFLAPDFTKFNRVDRLIEGLYIPWSSLFAAAGLALGVYSLAYLSIAFFGIKEREF